MPLPTIQLQRRPMTNAERQAAFRERNPGYYGRLHAKRRAAVRALAAARAAAAVPARTEPLMLPAPVEMPLFPGINAIPATLDALRESVLLPLPMSIRQPS